MIGFALAFFVSAFWLTSPRWPTNVCLRCHDVMPQDLRRLISIISASFSVRYSIINHPQVGSTKLERVSPSDWARSSHPQICHWHSWQLQQHCQRSTAACHRCTEDWLHLNLKQGNLDAFRNPMTISLLTLRLSGSIPLFESYQAWEC